MPGEGGREGGEGGREGRREGGKERREGGEERRRVIRGGREGVEGVWGAGVYLGP